jgi:hypothetical protein
MFQIIFELFLCIFYFQVYHLLLYLERNSSNKISNKVKLSKIHHALNNHLPLDFISKNIPKLLLIPCILNRNFKHMLCYIPVNIGFKI